MGQGAGGPSPRLIIIRGARKGEVIPFEGEPITLARSKGEGALLDREVSSRHAEVVQTPAGVLLRDLRSTNGTFLNGRSIQEALLAPGDEIVVGRTLLRWESGSTRREEPGESSRALGVWAPTVEFDPKKLGKSGAGSSAGPWAQVAEIDESPIVIEEGRSPLSDVRGYELFDISAAGLGLKVPQRCTMMLEVVEGPEKGRVVTFTKGELSLGRYGTDVVIKDSDISRLHSIIYAFGQDQIFIRDMKSTNGTFVNGVRIRFSRVQSGDTVVVGRSLVHLVVRRSC